jgi:hypothetical protein
MEKTQGRGVDWSRCKPQLCPYQQSKCLPSVPQVPSCPDGSSLLRSGDAYLDQVALDWPAL